ncbi:hypothetical protein OHV08_27655 [Streptomyces canus]|uniref:hypothetical protein n=1 Tax=Streptomyces canus TaxID=58343 RepID=UPI00324E89BC
MSAYWFVLIPIAALVLFVPGAMAVLKLQKASLRRMGSVPATASRAADRTGFHQSPQESREEFVRRHWQRSGLVADGVTLVDLYDRIQALEERVARAERRSASPPSAD